MDKNDIIRGKAQRAQYLLHENQLQGVLNELKEMYVAALAATALHDQVANANRVAIANKLSAIGDVLKLVHTDIKRAEDLDRPRNIPEKRQVFDING